MKKKLLVLNLILGVLAVGCSESAYTPNAVAPAYNTGTTPYFNNQIQPGMNQPMTNQQGMQMYQNYQQQGMLSWNMRMNIPGYYYNNYQYRSCIPQTPYITTCTQRTVRRTCSDCSTTTTTTDHTPSTSTVITTSTTTGDETTKVLPISWKDEDAKALYQRLAKEEETLEGAKLFKNSVKARTGENYKCIVDGSERKARNYVCDLEIRIKDGMLLQQLPIGKDGQPEVTESSMFKGDLLNIGTPGQAPEVGYLTIAGPSASYLFQNLPGESTQGKVEEAGNIEAKIKTAGQVKCYRTLNATRNVIECLIKIESNTGKALNF